MRKVQVYPSILSADFGYLAEQAKLCEESGADAIHFDIMDGHFVPNLSLSARSLAAVNRATEIPLDVHIMVYNPFDYVEELVASGADSITFHIEATEQIEETIEYIKKCGVKVGLAICPETSVQLVLNYLPKIDHLLIMTVNPGASGQAFIEPMLEKISFIRDCCTKLRIGKGGKTFNEGESFEPFDIQVDGGITDTTAKSCVEAGANVLISGSYLFKGDMQEKIQGLRAR